MATFPDRLPDELDLRRLAGAIPATGLRADVGAADLEQFGCAHPAGAALFRWLRALPLTEQRSLLRAHELAE